MSLFKDGCIIFLLAGAIIAASYQNWLALGTAVLGVVALIWSDL